MLNADSNKLQGGEQGAAPAAAHAPEPDWLRPLVHQILREQGFGAEPPTPFVDFSELCRRLPMYGERTIRSLIKRRILPAVRPPKSRKLGFFWPGVVEALKRHQTGGAE